MPAILESGLNRRVVGRLGVLPLPWGEGWGEGVMPLDMLEPPHPHPLPCGEREHAEFLASTSVSIKGEQ
jgi:hypothetical protein